MFTNARVKLTAWYLLIIMIISIFFSVAIYEVLARELDRFAAIQRIRIERRFHTNSVIPQEIQSRFPAPPNIEPELIEETKTRLILYLGALNVCILFLSGLFGFVLAGRTLKPIKNMIDEQNQFVSDASHELRTPLTSLKSAFEVYLRDKNKSLSESETLVKESLVEVNKLQTLSESLLRLAHFQKPNGKFFIIETSLKKIINEAVRKIKPIAKQKNIKITTIINDVNLQTNENNLIDILVIILDNAVKYSKRNKSIKIAAGKNDGYVVIKVIDNGIGIEKKDLPFIFNRFYRADSARSKIEAQGYGLGLSIAHQLIKILKGSINVNSQFGKGSEFIIKIPKRFS